MKWLEAKVILENDAAVFVVEVVADIFSDFGLQGTVIEAPDNEPEEGWGDDAPGRPEKPAVIGYFPQNHLIEKRCEQLEKRLSNLKRTSRVKYSVVYREIDEEDWAESWKTYFVPERITDRIIVKPTWREYDATPGDIILEIDPGMAFGTGIHPTTAACIQMIQTYLRSGDRMLDVGTGSGILMVAGAKLGASQISGIDIDEVAVAVARKNLVQNRIDPETFEVMTGNLIDPVKGRFELVVSNILSEIIIRLLDHIHLVLVKNGILICSGIIEKNRDPVVQKMISTGFEIIEAPVKEGWVAIAGRLK